MEPVLLLNASYAPLRVIEWTRAMGLITQGKAHTVEPSDVEVRTSSRAFRLPSVIRLNYMVHIPYKANIHLNRRSVLARDRGICQYGCGNKATTIDHIHPRSRGGKHEWLNVAAACADCNNKKASRTLDEIGWSLLNPPFVPDSSIWLKAGVNGDSRWESYIF